MKSLTKILVIAILSIMVFNGHAQNAGFKFGLNMANANLKNADGTSETDNKLLFAPRIGFTFETPVYNEVFIQTGLFVTASGYTYESERIPDPYENPEVSIESTEKFILLYLELPVNVGYKYALNDQTSLFGMVGPVFRYLTYSTLAFKIDGEWDNEETHLGEGDDKIELFDNFDFGLNIEIGAQIDRYQFSMFYSPSFTNIANEDLAGTDASWKNYCFGLNVGILFGEIK